ncbi:MAG: phenylalanine--tRNA ligase subunit beta [Solirubrobacterales bacterium]
MRVPLSWLRSHCATDWDTDHLAERLAMTGTEVERVSDFGAPSPEGYVVGRVMAVSEHPDADKLRVCEVDTGETRTIVCGAGNVAEGQLVAVALPGAVLPGGQKLTKAKLRGIVSDGMILSEREMELGDDAQGIAVLDHGATPGAPLTELIPVAEQVLELEITSNRPDCLGVYGVAREVHAISQAPLSEPPWSADAEALGAGQVAELASVEVKVPELCPRFTARVFTGVEVGPSPLWLKARLIAAGQRPINNIVDITNYAMLEIGQPMHAYDLDKVPGGRLIVDMAKEGERLTTLDGVERSFGPDTMLIYDADGPTGIAGLMGGASSEVAAGTTRVLLEVATWDGVNILRASRELGLRSEASARFEKQLHPELAMRGQRLASRLLVEVCGAKLVPGTLDVSGEIPPPHVVELRGERVEKVLGMRIEPERCREDLTRLGFGVVREGDLLTVTVPPERHYDVSREADLIEEVARVNDLDKNLPSTLPRTERVGRLTREQRLLRRAEDGLRGAGCDEIVTWSFNDPGLADRLRLDPDDARRGAIEIANPLSAEQSAMRTTLLGGLLDAARLNLSRGNERVRMFESGHVYLQPQSAPAPAVGALGGDYLGKVAPPAYEPHRLGALLGGPAPPSWRESDPGPDYFVAKAVVEALTAALGVELAFEAPEEPEPFLHPGRSATISLGDQPVGWIGELHPLVARAWDLPACSAFELDAAPLVAGSPVGEETYEDVTTFPAVLQDISVIVAVDVPAAQVRDAVLEAGGALLRSAEVFDRYAGEQVGEDRISLALRLEFRASDRTLTDQEVAECHQAIAGALEKLGGSLRER